MKTLPSYFIDFLADIRPTEGQRTAFRKAHTDLRDRLNSEKSLEKIIVGTFLQGSYRRSTAIRPENGKKSDVDLIVVTKLSKDDVSPDKAIGTFVPFADKHYKGNWEAQGRSIKLKDGEVELDLVVTAAPSEAEVGILQKAQAILSDDTLDEVKDWRLSSSWVALAERSTEKARRLLENAVKESEWKFSPLLIPDKEVKRWEPTHPIAQIQWTRDKNNNCNGHYINVVKAIKWWRRLQHQTPKYPKGYPVEHLIGLNCPDGINSIAEGIVISLENITKNYQQDARSNTVPFLSDHGVPGNNVLKRISGQDFSQFYQQVRAAALIARGALQASDTAEAVESWKKLFGERFPSAPASTNGGNRGGFTPREQPSVVTGGRFA